jgi:transcriptional regulator of acetoin/glycerol metabolism
MYKLMLFTDGSVNTHSNIGYGAYLSVPENLLEIELFGYVAGAFNGAVKDINGSLKKRLQQFLMTY